jgi:hypothetical protein
MGARVAGSTGKGLIGALVTVVVGGGIVMALATGVAAAAPHQAALTATSDGTITIDGTTYPHATLNLATFPDSMFSNLHGANGGAHPNWVSWANDNLVVPANSAITVTVDQYDSGGTPNNLYFAHVHGTVGGVETVNGKTVTSVPVDGVGHTMTLRQISGNAPDLFFSVPLPAVSASAPNVLNIGGGQYPKPNVVTFTFITKGPGTYEWNCEFPCGSVGSPGQFGGAMSVYGYMSGTMKVV